MELRQRTEAGLNRRFGGLPDGKLLEVRSRLETELATIGGLGFDSYFLTVAEVSEMIKDMGVRRAARGSGASSLVNYLLGISAVDPIANDLLFERFLSLDRSTLPDIDLDVESAERHNVYRRIFERFGSQAGHPDEHAKQLPRPRRRQGCRAGAGHGQGRDRPNRQAAVAVFGRVLQGGAGGEARAARFCRPGGELPARGRAAAQLDLLVDLTERLDSLPRHISMHPCGVILGDSSLLNRTPVQPSGLGLPMSQFDKHDMDAMGMLKLDVLGVRMQSAMAYAVREIIRLHPSKEAGGGAGRARTRTRRSLDEGGAIDLDAVPLDDEPTFELIRSTHTLGCFQIESPGQRELVGKMAPTEFSDLVIDISLFRPGPMKSNMVKPYLENRAGFTPRPLRPPGSHPGPCGDAWGDGFS